MTLIRIIFLIRCSNFFYACLKNNLIYDEEVLTNKKNFNSFKK